MGDGGPELEDIEDEDGEGGEDLGIKSEEIIKLGKRGRECGWGTVVTKNKTDFNTINGLRLQRNFIPHYSEKYPIPPFLSIGPLTVRFSTLCHEVFFQLQVHSYLRPTSCRTSPLPSPREPYCDLSLSEDS